MKAYRIVVLALALAVVASTVLWLVGSDPGYVLVQWRGADRQQVRIESTLVFAVLALLAAWLATYLLFWLLRWPSRALRARARRLALQRYHGAVLALAEGHLARAQKMFAASARAPGWRLPALLGASYAAWARKDGKRLESWLARLAQTPRGERAATLIRAQHELDEGRAGTVIELLSPWELQQRLPPRGAWQLAQALCQRGRAREAVGLLPHFLQEGAFASYARGITIQALWQASDGGSLRALWAELPDVHRQAPEVALAYAHRARLLRVGESVVPDLEQVLRKSWSNTLVQAWGQSLGSEFDQHLRTAEDWLKQHPQSPELLVALGRLCRLQQVWGKAESYLHQALSHGAGALAWEELGALYAAQQDPARAVRALQNALRAARGEEPVSLSARNTAGDLAVPRPVGEHRNAHGVPMLPPSEQA